MTDFNNVIVDLESTVKNTIGNNKGSAFCPNNYVVMSGSAYPYSKNVYTGTHSKGENLSFKSKPTLLIGHNIGFDLHHVRKNMNRDNFNDVWKSVLLWDTSIVEYMLSGQREFFPSLDNVSPRYGGTIKDKKIKEMWDAGIQTEDMDKDLLGEYLKGDVNNTRLVFEGQLERVEKLGMLPLVWARMKALKATIEMEWNGLYINQKTLSESIKITQTQLSDLELELIQYISAELSAGGITSPTLVTSTFIRSNKKLRTFFYGGVFTEDVREPNGVFKTGPSAGQTKFKVNHVEYKWFPRNPLLVNGTLNQNSMSEDDINRLIALGQHPDIEKILSLILEYRVVNKELNTYLLGIQDLIFPDGFIHGNINHTATGTGRLSSSNPNLQNFTNKE